MKNSRKPGAGNVGHKKGNKQPRPHSEKKSASHSARRLGATGETKPRDAAAPHPRARKEPQRNEEDRKRKLYERKQAELEARWVAAQSRQADAAMARKRTTKIVAGATGVVIALVLGMLAWYYF